MNSSNGKSEAKSISKIINTLHELDIADVWREVNPTGRDYTHYSSAHQVYSPLAYFFTFKKDLYRFDKYETGPSTLSDHSPVYMLVHLDTKMKTALWWLNSNIITIIQLPRKN